MTFLNHPTRGRNGLWRSGVYTSVAELEALFENPRKHTSTGYRKSENAEAGCTQCGERKKRSEFSKNQWVKRKEDKQKCAVCVADIQQLDSLTNNMNKLDLLAKDERMRACSSCGDMRLYSDFQSATDNICKECEDNEALLEFADLSISRGEEVPPGSGSGSGKGKGLTSKDLATHNKKNINFERRQFNCPRHPPHSFIFFKQVPLVKPVAKCPRCKSKKQQGGGEGGGKQQVQPRLQPVPRDLEKGYGLFKCLTPGCGSTWGSSRACRSYGQLCLDPRGLGCSENVFPFRIDKLRPKRVKTDAQGNRYRFKKAQALPPVQEDEEKVDFGTYTATLGGLPPSTSRTQSADSDGSFDFMSDHERNSSDGESAGSWTMLNSGDNNSNSNSHSLLPRPPPHHCTGCASGGCSSRDVPFSREHDSTGSTASTASIRTFSTVDFNDYKDRDRDDYIENY